MLFLSTHATDVLLAMTGKSFCIDSLFFTHSTKGLSVTLRNSIQFKPSVFIGLLLPWLMVCTH